MQYSNRNLPLQIIFFQQSLLFSKLVIFQVNRALCDVRQAHHANFRIFLNDIVITYYLLNKFQIHKKDVLALENYLLVEKITYNQFEVMIFLKIIKLKSTFKFCQYLNEENIDIIHLNICVFRLHEKIFILGKL